MGQTSANREKIDQRFDRLNQIRLVTMFSSSRKACAVSGGWGVAWGKEQRSGYCFSLPWGGRRQHLIFDTVSLAGCRRRRLPETFMLGRAGRSGGFVPATPSLRMGERPGAVSSLRCYKEITTKSPNFTPDSSICYLYKPPSSLTYVDVPERLLEYQSMM